MSIRSAALRRWRARVVVCCALGAAVLAVLAAPPGRAAAHGTGRFSFCRGANVPVVSLSAVRERAAIRCLVNLARARAGDGRVRASHGLHRVAEGHALDMVRRRFFSHVTPDGATLGDRLQRGTVRIARAGEALAWRCGPATPATAVRMWLNSPPHREVLLDPRYTRVGVGTVPAAPIAGCGVGATWTLLLATLRG